MEMPFIPCIVDLHIILSKQLTPYLLLFFFGYTNFVFLRHRQTSSVRRNSWDNKPVDHSDVVEAPHVGAAPTTSSFST